MKLVEIFSILSICAFSYGNVHAQEHKDENINDITEEHENKNVALFFVGNTIISQSNYQMPTVGVEYVRELNHRIGLGLVAELEIGSHIIQTNEEGDVIAEVERKSAFLVLPTVIFRVYKDLILTVGYGVELEKNENLALSRVGIEYVFKMQNPNWIIAPSINWDHTKLFDGAVYGVSAGYFF